MHVQSVDAYDRSVLVPGEFQQFMNSISKKKIFALMFWRLRWGYRNPLRAAAKFQYARSLVFAFH